MWLKWKTCLILYACKRLPKVYVAKTGSKSNVNFLREAELVWIIGTFETSGLQESGIKLQWLTVAKWSNIKGMDFSSENSGVSKNRVSVWKIGIPLYLLLYRTLRNQQYIFLSKVERTLFVLMPSIFSLFLFTEKNIITQLIICSSKARTFNKWINQLGPFQRSCTRKRGPQS